MSSAVPIGRGSTSRSVSFFQCSAANTASTAAAAIHGQGPRQNFRVGSHFMASESSRAGRTRHWIARLYWAAVLAGPRANPIRLLALAALVASCATASCGPRDPLEKIRVLQDEKHDYKGSLEPLQKLLETRFHDPEVHFRYGAALAASGTPALAV